MVCTLIDHRNDVKFAKLSLSPGLFTVDCEGVHARASDEDTRNEGAFSHARDHLCVSRVCSTDKEKRDTARSLVYSHFHTNP